MQVETGTGLSPAEQADLRCLAAIMIPAGRASAISAAALRPAAAGATMAGRMPGFNNQAVTGPAGQGASGDMMPGADDPLIFADILRSIGRDMGDVRAGLAALAEKAGHRLAQLDPVTAEAHALPFLGQTSRAATALGRVVLQCYYRDDRVLQALGLEARAPFPHGHKVEQGDWSLLDPVRDRAPFWRDDRRA